MFNNVSEQPFHLIHHLSENEWNYNIAIDILKAEYWDRNAICEVIFEKLIQDQSEMDKNYEHLKEYLAQVQYELKELDSDYGYDFLVEGLGSGALVAHILFAKIPCEVKAELIRGSTSSYPSLDCILHYTSNVIKALLQVRPESAHRTNTSHFRSRTDSSWNRNNLGGTTEGFHVDLDFEGSPHFCNFCVRNRHSSVNFKAYPSYGEWLKQCKQLSLCQSCSDASHHSRACPNDKSLRACCNFCHACGHLSVLYPELKPDESGINVNASANASITQNILPMIRTTIKRRSYSVSLTCLLNSGSQRSYFSEVLDHLHCDPNSLEDVALDVIFFVGKRHRQFKQLMAMIDLFPGAAHQVLILIDNQLDLTHKIPGLPLVWKNLQDLGLDLATDITSGYVHLWGLIGVDFLQHMYSIRVVDCMQGTAWETPDISCSTTK